MKSIVEKVNTPATQAEYAYALAETASIKLMFANADEVRKDLDAASKILEKFNSIEVSIYAAFYRVNADYYSVLAAHNEELT
jgi:hypothetical protein